MVDRVDDKKRDELIYGVVCSGFCFITTHLTVIITEDHLWARGTVSTTVDLQPPPTMTMSVSITSEEQSSGTCSWVSRESILTYQPKVDFLWKSKIIKMKNVKLNGQENPRI